MATATTLDCGHAPTATEGIGTGTAHAPDGTTMCYACAEKTERDAFAKARVFTGYVSSAHPGTFTTWTGGELAKVTRSAAGRTRWTPTGGQYRMRYITAVSPDGRTWMGHGSDNWELFTLRTNNAPVTTGGELSRDSYPPFRRAS